MTAWEFLLIKSTADAEATAWQHITSTPKIECIVLSNCENRSVSIQAALSANLEVIQLSIDMQSSLNINLEATELSTDMQAALITNL